MQTAAAQIGAAISNATNGGQVVVAAPSCASAAGAAQCASASYTLTQGGNCTAGVPPAGSNCFWNPANLCNTGQATLFVAFDQSF